MLHQVPDTGHENTTCRVTVVQNATYHHPFGWNHAEGRNRAGRARGEPLENPPRVYVDIDILTVRVNEVNICRNSVQSLAERFYVFFCRVL